MPCGAHLWAAASVRWWAGCRRVEAGGGVRSLATAGEWRAGDRWRERGRARTQAMLSVAGCEHRLMVGSVLWGGLRIAHGDTSGGWRAKMQAEVQHLHLMSARAVIGEWRAFALDTG